MSRVYDVLFRIPHEAAGWPLFGWGWVTVAWVVVGGILVGWNARRGGAQGDLMGSLMLYGIGIALFFWLAPRMEDVEPVTMRKLGIAIHGYGVLVTIGVVAGVGLGMREGRRMGADSEMIYGFAMRLFVAGIIGARAFYVALYWEEYARPTWFETLVEVAKFTQGGLVVYGSFIAALIVGGHYLWTRKIPVLAMADLAVPSMLVGLAFGRVGCFLHGCCFGGECPADRFAVTFPELSPPYVHQLQRGRMHGVKLGIGSDNRQLLVVEVDESGPAADAGLKVGDEVRKVNGVEVDAQSRAWFPPGPDWGAAELELGDGRKVRWRVTRLPPRSRTVHPIQLYSAGGAAALALVLWAWYPLRRRDGEVMAGLLTLYPITRILEEAVRDDEPGRWGTPLTISQWVSVGLLLVGSVLWWYVLCQPVGCRRFDEKPA